MTGSFDPTEIQGLGPPDDDPLASTSPTGGGDEPSISRVVTSSLTNLVDCCIDGKYEVVREIGGGGMGTVWEARRPAVGGRNVAIKTIAPHLATNSELRERFLQEAKAAGQLDTGYVVKILDTGRYAGLDYVVMDLADMDLARYARSAPEKRLELETALRFMRQSAMALLAAERHVNAAGQIEPIVHRDLKPENILLVENPDSDDRELTVRIADFGAAKFMDSAVTVHSAPLTPGYASPEQWEALGEMVDHRSDMYSLGLTFYEVLTGVRAIKRGITTRGAYELVQNTDCFDPAAQHELLPDSVCALIRRMTAREVDERYPSFANVIEEIDRILVELEPEEPVAAAKPSPMRWVMAAVVVLGAVGAAFALGGGDTAAKSDPPTDVGPTPMPRIDAPTVAEWLDQYREQEDILATESESAGKYVAAFGAARTTIDQAVRSLETLKRERGSNHQVAESLLAAQLPSIGAIRKELDGARHVVTAARRAESALEALGRRFGSLSTHGLDKIESDPQLAVAFERFDSLRKQIRVCRQVLSWPEALERSGRGVLETLKKNTVPDPDLKRFAKQVAAWHARAIAQKATLDESAVESSLESLEKLIKLRIAWESLESEAQSLNDSFLARVINLTRTRKRRVACVYDQRGRPKFFGLLIASEAADFTSRWRETIALGSQSARALAERATRSANAAQSGPRDAHAKLLEEARRTRTQYESVRKALEAAGLSPSQRSKIFGADGEMTALLPARAADLPEGWPSGWRVPEGLTPTGRPGEYRIDGRETVMVLVESADLNPFLCDQVPVSAAEYRKRCERQTKSNWVGTWAAKALSKGEADLEGRIANFVSFQMVEAYLQECEGLSVPTLTQRLAMQSLEEGAGKPSESERPPRSSELVGARIKGLHGGVREYCRVGTAIKLMGEPWPLARKNRQKPPYDPRRPVSRGRAYQDAGFRCVLNLQRAPEPGPIK